MAWSEVLGLGSSILEAICVSLLARFVIWPSPAHIGLFAGLVLWQRKISIYDVVGASLSDASSLAGPVIGPGIALFVLWVVTLIMGRTDGPEWSGPGRPLLLPSRTTHSRLFPQKHSFSYSYLVVGIPIGWSGAAGGMVSADLPGLSSGWLSWLIPRATTAKAWYHVDAADYLERGNGHLGLRGKLDAYLKSLGIDPELYPYAYLLTAAKFLGYHFNPVSFWYLYGPDKELTAMILEVNNTFGERRMYFLVPPSSGPTREIGHPGTDNTPGEGATDRKPLTRLLQTWPKDFHVSPFNSRKGSYTLNAHDVLAAGMEGPGNIDITIVLKSSKAHGKLVAKIFSEGPSVDPTKMNVWQRFVFLARWWWVGFVTFPRIVKEAGVLFFVRKLHVWFRPEPLKESMGRQADKTERELEVVFRRYLRHLVEQSKVALAVKYVPGGLSESAKELMLSPSARSESGQVEELEFKVLTPVFYSRFACYAHDLEALFCELRESNTIWVSRPELFPKLALKEPSSPLEAPSYLDFVLFKAIQRLRRRPERIERPLTSSQTAVRNHDTTEDLRGFRISSMDAFVLSSGDAKMKASYRKSVLKLFLADRLALGMVSLLEAQQCVLGVVATWLVACRLDGAFGWVDTLGQWCFGSSIGARL